MFHLKAKRTDKKKQQERRSLQRLAKKRKAKLVESESDSDEFSSDEDHVFSLMFPDFADEKHPAKTQKRSLCLFETLGSLFAANERALDESGGSASGAVDLAKAISECASEFPEEDIVAINSMVVKWYKDTEPYHTKEDWDNYFKGQSEAVSELILLSKLKTVTELADIISAARTTHATFLKSKPITALSFTKALLFSDNKSLLINFLGVPKEKIVVLVSQVITFARERAANRTAAELQSILSVLIN